ncbi:MAG: FAD-dependent oxidoreductase [Desulfobacterales bacterium]|jgi:thioredoxin reductase/bacterioferritin-associated ferredoxin
MMRSADVIVVGGGPAGVSAATEAAKNKLSVVLIDENTSLGGKVFRPEEAGAESDNADPLAARLRNRLFKSFESVADGIRVCLGSEVWNIEGSKTVYVYSDRDRETSQKVFQGKRLIIAPGAIERVMPFEGWTTPGVFTVGGLNALVKKKVVPGKRILIAGSGPLPLALINNLLQAKVKIVGIVVPTSIKTIIQNAIPMLSCAGRHRIKQGFEAIWCIRANHIPVFNAHVLKRVTGRHTDFKATLVQIGPDWKPMTGSEKEVSADAIAVGYGLVPSVELTQLAGCEHCYDETLGYWRAVRSPRLETTVPGIFVAGDGAQVKGYEAAVNEGKLAGVEAAHQLGQVAQKDANQWIGSLEKKLKKMAAFGKILDRLSTPEPGLLEIVPDTTTVCRCEEVTLGEIKKAVGDGAASINDIKRRTRLGMGHCQGRFCGQVINELLSLLNKETRTRGSFTPRIPVRPVPFKVLAG